MGALGFLSIGFAPGLLWLWLIVRRSRHRPEPRSLILRTFLLGVAVAVPIVLAESLVGGPKGGHSTHMSAQEAAFTAFFVAGLCEEVGKFWMVQATLGRSPYLDTPLRGLIFSSAVALGFSSIENVVYMVTYGAEVIILRAVLCTLGHVAFSSLWGFAIGWANQYPKRRHARLLLGVGASIGLHGLYDYFLFVGESGNAYLTFVSGAVLFFVVLGRSRNASQAVHSTIALFSCLSCGRTAPGTATFCPDCGNRLDSKRSRHCGRCKAALPNSADFCPNCGAGVTFA